jgi:hypothetical protein
MPPKRPARADEWEEPTSVGTGTATTAADDALGAALLDALAAVAKARVHLAESTPEERAAVAGRLSLLRAEVAALPVARGRSPIGFGPDGLVTSRRRARELRDKPVRR